MPQNHTPPTLPQSPKQYFTGFDYLRAIFSLLVVLLHGTGLSFLTQINQNLQIIPNIVYQNVCLLAVPVFLQISLFLFYRKSEKDDTYFINKRLPQLLSIYGIWMIIGAFGSAFFTRGKYFLKIFDLTNLPMTLVRGTRDELYFIFSLIFLTTLASLYIKYFHPEEFLMQFFYFLFSLTIPLACILASYLTHEKSFTDFWNPINFIPYIFSASILTQLHQNWFTNSEQKVIKYAHKMKIAIGCLFSIYGLLSWLEWQFLNIPEIFGYTLPIYSRPSLVFGSSALIMLGFLITSKPPHIIKIISQESLGIYVMHVYFLHFMGSPYGYILGGRGILPPLLNLAVPILLSLSISRLAKKYPVGKVMFGQS